MNSEVREVLQALTPKRYEILNFLVEERHPDDVARELSISRQAADKHLSILYRLGMVEKRIKEGRRPMVFYRISEPGRDLLGKLDEIVDSYICALRDEYAANLRALDEKLVYGEISESEYWRIRRKMEARFQWLR